MILPFHKNGSIHFHDVLEPQESPNPPRSRFLGALLRPSWGFLELKNARSATANALSATARCLEQPVLITPMRRQPVLGCVYGNLCRFDFCAEQPVHSLLVLLATCARNTSAPATCARLCLWQPVPLRPLRRATCALAAGA